MKTVLLHSCCAPCSAPILEWMLENDITPIVYFFNPNIFPYEEYEKRKQELIWYISSLNLRFIDGDYNHEHWLENIRGLENRPERGARCAECFKIRLEAAAMLAAELNIEIFSTTLSSSRWKDWKQIYEAGVSAERKVTNVRFWTKDWKKGGLTERRAILLREQKFYNQQYCGCEFSMRK
ncbi:MAG: epoxyqueuosine reductase QueH [Rikenellaceae bacterium]|nr:epoxyqueuosine reductase QueH [Rikenellaceae bacterium]